MVKKTCGKMLLIITTCMSVVTALSLFGNMPQHLLAGEQRTLYNRQNVMYDSQKAGDSHMAYKTYCADNSCTFQYAGEGSDKRIAVINMDKDDEAMAELARIVDADLIAMSDDIAGNKLNQYNTIFVKPSSDDYKVSEDIKAFADNINLDGKTIIVIYDEAQDIINGVSGADKLMDNTVWLTGGRLSDNAGYEDIKDWVNGLGMELIADDEE